MQRFINLSYKDSADLHYPIYKNALQLKKDAMLLAESTESYSSATSLLVLSSEEVIKATLVFLHSKQYHVYRIKGAKRFFTDHKIRHQLSQLVEMGSGFFKSIDSWENAKNKEKVFKTKSKFWNTLLNGIKHIAEATKPFIASIERIKKIEEFNNLKNQGLYTDYRDGLLTPQNEINKDLYEGTKVIVNRVFSLYKGLNILFHPSLDKHLSKEEINKHKEDLKILINDALQDFKLD